MYTGFDPRDIEFIEKWKNHPNPTIRAKVKAKIRNCQEFVQIQEREKFLKEEEERKRKEEIKRADQRREKLIQYRIKEEERKKEQDRLEKIRIEQEKFERKLKEDKEILYKKQKEEENRLKEEEKRLKEEKEKEEETNKRKEEEKKDLDEGFTKEELKLFADIEKENKEKEEKKKEDDINAYNNNGGQLGSIFCANNALSLCVIPNFENYADKIEVNKYKLEYWEENYPFYFMKTMNMYMSNYDWVTYNLDFIFIQINVYYKIFKDSEGLALHKNEVLFLKFKQYYLDYKSKILKFKCSHLMTVDFIETILNKYEDLIQYYLEA